MRHLRTEKQFSVAMTAGWGVVFSAPPEELTDSKPSAALEEVLAECERWLVSAKPADVRVELIEDDDRGVRIGFENGVEVDEALSATETVDLQLRLAQGAVPMYAPYADVFEAQGRMQLVMAPIGSVTMSSSF